MTDPVPSAARTARDTKAPRRRRRKPAAVGRILTTGISATALCAIVGAFALDAAHSESANQPQLIPAPDVAAAGAALGVTETTSPVPTPTPATATPPPTIIVRRLHVLPAPSQGTASPAANQTPLPSPAPTPAAPTPMPVVTSPPAPRPAPVPVVTAPPVTHTQSGGS